MSRNGRSSLYKMVLTCAFRVRSSPPSSTLNVVTFAVENCMKNGIPWGKTFSLQRKLVKELTRNAGVVVPEEDCVLPEIERFQRYFAPQDIVILVYSFNIFGRGGGALLYCVVLTSLGREARYKLYIMYYERARYYNHIFNLKAAAGSKRYCVAYNWRYLGEASHRCSNMYPRCLSTPSCEDLGTELVRCAEFGQTFYGAVYFERHRVQKKSRSGKSASSV